MWNYYVSRLSPVDPHSLFGKGNRACGYKCLNWEEEYSVWRFLHCFCTSTRWRVLPSVCIFFSCFLSCFLSLTSHFPFFFALGLSYCFAISGNTAGQTVTTNSSHASDTDSGQRKLNQDSVRCVEVSETSDFTCLKYTHHWGGQAVYQASRSNWGCLFHPIICSGKLQCRALICSSSSSQCPYIL